MLQVIRNTLQRVEKFKYLGVVVTSDGRRNEEIDTGTVKTHAVLHELYRSVATIRMLSNTARLSVFESVSRVMTERILSQKCKRQTLDFCEESTVLYFVTKCVAVKFAEPWMSNHFSESRDHSYVVSATCPECATKNWRGKRWLNLRESGPDVQRLGWMTTSPTLLGHVLVWRQQNYLKLQLTVRYSESSWYCCPTILPTGKTGMELNEWMS